MSVELWYYSRDTIVIHCPVWILFFKKKEKERRGVCVINIVHSVFIECEESIFCLFTAIICNNCNNCNWFFMLFIIVQVGRGLWRSSGPTPPCQAGPTSKLHWAESCPFLNITKNGDSTTFLCSLIQHFTALRVNVFSLSDQNLSCCNLCLLTFILSLCISEESFLHLPIRHLQIAVSLLSAEQTQLSQPVLVCHTPASAGSGCMLLDSLQHVNNFWTGEALPKDSSWDAVPQLLNRREEALLLICCLHLYWYGPVCCWPFPRGHAVGSCSTWTSRSFSAKQVSSELPSVSPGAWD